MAGVSVFIVSLLVYLRTVAPTTSFWDCGEFIACSRILGVMHPPGSPLFLLIGRLGTLLPVAVDIGLRVNLISVLVSAATVLLTYLIIVQLITRWRGRPENSDDRIILYVSGVLGALAFAFTDSFWFNAVEAEVYAFSMFFTALVIWLALLWEEHSRESSGLLLIFFIFYLFGLATGIHLLNILAFPFVILIAFFHHNQRVRHLLLLIFLQAAVPLLLYVVFYQFDPSILTHRAIQAHQARANQFLMIFGGLWLLVSLIYVYFKHRPVFYAWWVLPVLVLVAYSTYLLIFIRAGLRPPINENDPSTLSGMIYYLSRKQYGDTSLLLTFLHRNADFWHYQINLMFHRYFGWQFIGQGVMLDGRDRIIEIVSLRGLYGLPFFVGLLGAVHHFRRDWKRALAVLVLFLVMGYAVIVYLNQPDPQPRERDYSYVGAFFAFALWIGTGMAGLLESVSTLFKEKSTIKWAGFTAVTLLLLAAVPLNLFAFNFDSHDRSGNYVASDYALNMLNSCEPNAILFTNGDNDTFPLWFLQEVEGVRKDVRVVNLSLLNTGWYVRQLQEQEPRIPCGLSDDDLDNLFPMAWKTQSISIPVDSTVIQKLKNELPPEAHAELKEAISFTLRPTIGTEKQGALRIQDMMILRILIRMKWRRPVYFAMTVSQSNQIGLNPFLRVDGLAYKVVPYKPRQIDADRLEQRLTRDFQYRSLSDESVYLNLGIQKLMQNYRTLFHQLAQFYVQSGDTTRALASLDFMNEKMPPHHVNYASEYSALITTQLYRQAGRDVPSDAFARHVIPHRKTTKQEAMQTAMFYARYLQEYTRADSILSGLQSVYPGDVQLLSTRVQTLLLAGKNTQAVQLMKEWIAAHPTDTYAKQQLKMIERIRGNSDTDR